MINRNNVLSLEQSSIGLGIGFIEIMYCIIMFRQCGPDLSHQFSISHEKYQQRNDIVTRLKAAIEKLRKCRISLQNNQSNILTSLTSKEILK